MNEVKPLFDKNNETIYIASEANVKPMYMTEHKHNDYQNLMYQLFTWHAKEYYDVALPMRKEMMDFSEMLNGKVNNFYQAIKYLKDNVNLHEIYKLPWTFTLNDTTYEKSVTVVSNFAPSETEEGEYDKSKILVDVKIEPYPVEKLDCEIEYTCPSTPIVRDTYYLTDDIDNYIIKKEATDDIVAIIKRDKLRDWEAFHAASDVVNYLNLSEEEKHKPLGEW